MEVVFVTGTMGTMVTTPVAAEASLGARLCASCATGESLIANCERLGMRGAAIIERRMNSRTTTISPRGDVTDSDRTVPLAWRVKNSFIDFIEFPCIKLDITSQVTSNSLASRCYGVTLIVLVTVALLATLAQVQTTFSPVRTQLPPPVADALL